MLMYFRQSESTELKLIVITLPLLCVTISIIIIIIIIMIMTLMIIEMMMLLKNFNSGAEFYDEHYSKELNILMECFCNWRSRWNCDCKRLLVAGRKKIFYSEKIKFTFFSDFISGNKKKTHNNWYALSHNVIFSIYIIVSTSQNFVCVKSQ
jgi:hypothetical protein